MTKYTKTIELFNVQLMLYIGVHQHERNDRQRLLVSVSVRVKDYEEGDNIENTLDYDQLYGFLKKLEQLDHIDLQETVCRKILKYALDVPGVEYVSVSTRKPDILEDTEFVGVTMTGENDF
jgi:dihydroneopterin aldolase